MNEDKEKKLYELALLLKTEEDLVPLIALIRQYEGEIVLEPRAKKLALAYKIKGHTEAIFATLQFNAFPEAAKNLEQDLNNRPEAIRFLILASPPPPERREESMPSFPGARRGRPSTPRAATPSDAKPAAPRASGPLSNEALGKKIEEILQ
jgi:ribosomal protein S6